MMDVGMIASTSALWRHLLAALWESGLWNHPALGRGPGFRK